MTKLDADSSRIDPKLVNRRAARPALVGINDVPQLWVRFKALGATDAILRVVVGYSGQCNLEFSNATLQVLAAAGVPLTVSCYLDSFEEEERD